MLSVEPSQAQNVAYLPNTAIICGFRTAEQNQCTDNDSQHTLNLLVSHGRVKSPDSEIHGWELREVRRNPLFHKWLRALGRPGKNSNISLCDVKITIPRDGSAPLRGRADMMI